jgi:hypothetical protein
MTMDWQQVHEAVKAMSNRERDDFARRHHLRLSKLDDIALSASYLSQTTFVKLRKALLAEQAHTQTKED